MSAVRFTPLRPNPRPRGPSPPPYERRNPHRNARFRSGPPTDTQTAIRGRRTHEEMRQQAATPLRNLDVAIQPLVDQVSVPFSIFRGIGSDN
jgi:hypothetical protein